MSDYPQQIKGCIFNLDGVIVDMSGYHFLAWRRLANELGFDFSLAQQETLRGLDRISSLEQILEWGGMYMSEAEKLHWADVKNNWFLESVIYMKPAEVLPGVLYFLRQIRSAGLKMALSSGSRNAKAILQSIRLDDFFDVVVDGNIVRKQKPDPNCFLMAAAALGLRPAECVVFEDLPIGISAALNGGIPVVGIGCREQLRDASLVISGFEGETLERILAQLPVAQNIMNE